MKRKILFGALAGAAVLLLVAATTTEINVANLPLATSLSPTNLVLVLTNATKARLATAQQILNVPGYKVWTNASGVLSPVGFADQAQLSLSDTNNVRLSLISGDVNGAYSHVFSTANYLTSEYQALNTDGTNEYLATLSASLEDSFSQLQLRKTIGANVTSSIQLVAKDAPSVLIYDTNGIVFSVVTNGTITIQGQTNRIGDNGSQITFNGAAVGGGTQVWTNYSATDSEGGSIRGIYSTISGTPNGIVNVAWNYLTNFFTQQASVCVLGVPPVDASVIAEDNSTVLGLGDFTLSNTDIHRCFDITGIGGQTLSFSSFTNCHAVHAFGTYAIDSAYLTNCLDITGIGYYALEGAALNDSDGVLAIGHYALEGAVLTNSHDLIAVGNRAGASGFSVLNGTFRDVIMIGTDASVGTAGTTNAIALGWNAIATNSNTAVVGNGITDFYFSGEPHSPSGFASTDTTAAVSIASTGWTNTVGKLARVFFNGTAMTYTVFDSAASPFYTNAVALTGSEMIILQPSEAVTISGAGVAGRAKPL